MSALTRSRVRLLIVAVALLIVLPSLYGYWYYYVRPWTIREVLEADGLRAGMVRDLEGTITNVSRLNTSYGPAAGLELDGDKTCQQGSVFGEPGTTYRIGDRFRTTLHFVDYEFNGKMGIWAPEMLCPFPWTSALAVSSIDAISYASGKVLLANESDGDSWYIFEVVFSASSMSARNLSVSLRDGLPLVRDPRTGGPFFLDSAANWIVLAGAEYGAVQGLYASHPELDRMASMTDPTSLNGRIRFVDAGAPGAFDLGDKIELRLTSTSGAGHYGTYVLVVYDPVALNQPVAAKYVVHGFQGPYEWTDFG